jgi:hypothetical protein
LKKRFTFEPVPDIARNPVHLRFSDLRFSGTPQKRHLAPLAAQDSQMKKYLLQ